MLGLRRRGADGPPRKEVRSIDRELRKAAHAASDARALREIPEGADPEEALAAELELLGVMRTRLHELGRSGRHTTSALRYVLDELDAYEISIRLRLESEKK
ncbi:hypothetical protein [Microbacterium sp.]|uniref:hypothetical protein n=1 Tax=Microbacterium sp. TaxID=51671 RepID=UPI003A8DBCE0